MENKNINARIATKGFIVNDNKLLIIKRAPDEVQMPGIWEVPGGRLDPGEHPQKGLQREVEEETGLTVEVKHPLSVRHFERVDGQTITMMIFLCKVLDNQVKGVKLSEEHSEYEWIPIEKSKDKISEFYHDEVDMFQRLKSV